MNRGRKERHRGNDRARDGSADPTGGNNVRPAPEGITAGANASAGQDARAVTPVIAVPAAGVEKVAWPRRGGFGRALLWVILALSRLVGTTLLVFALVGGASYLIVKTYVGSADVAVPNVCGIPVEEALDKLATPHLQLELDRREYNEAIPRGSVIAQFPSPGMKVKINTPVRVVLSDGAVRVPLPNLVGLSEINAGVAVRAIPQADLDIGPGALTYSGKVKKGDVIAQDPPAGTRILRGSKVKLLVSLGQRPVDYHMPDLRNKTIQEARAALGTLQLTLGEVREADQPGVLRGIIVAQQPAPGRRVSPGTAVTLTVATGLGEPTPRP
jgi:serine/threonine-protein kinase